MTVPASASGIRQRLERLHVRIMDLWRSDEILGVSAPHLCS